MANIGVDSYDPVGDAFSVFEEQIAGLQGDALRAYDDLEFYSRWCMGYQNSEYTRNSRMLRTVYETLQYSDERNILILGPRGSAKSTAVTVAYTTWKAGRNNLIRFMLAFAAMEKQGFAFGRQIGQVIESNKRYIEIFGELKPRHPEKWTDEEKIVRRSTPPGGLKDATFTITGFGSNVPSKRVDEVICDDLVTAENAYSVSIQDKMELFLFQTLRPCLVPGGRTVVVGSRWDPNELYSRVARRWNISIPEPLADDISPLRNMLPAQDTDTVTNIAELSF